MGVDLERVGFEESSLKVNTLHSSIHIHFSLGVCGECSTSATSLIEAGKFIVGASFNFAHV